MTHARLTCLSCGQANRVPADRLSAGPKCGTCGAPLVGDRVAEIDPATLAKATRDDGLPLVVDFWAPWCGPCRMMAPEFARAATDLKGRARFAKLNSEEHPQAAQAHGIRGIPTMIVFDHGREARRQSGALRAGQIVDWVRGGGH